MSLEESALSSDVRVFLFVLMNLCVTVWLYVRLLIVVLKLTDCAVLRLCVCPTVCLFAVFVSQKWAWLTICDVHKHVFVFAAAITSLPAHYAVMLREAGIVFIVVRRVCVSVSAQNK